MNRQREELKRLKLESAMERCEAIEESLKLFHGRIESSPATRKVIALMLTATSRIKQFIETESANPHLELLTDGELESRVHRVTRVIPAIHLLLGIVEHSDVTSVPAELVAPLRREIDNLYSSSAELIITSSPTLNYSIQRLAVADIQQSLNLQRVDVKTFPKRLFVASLPSIEYGQALQHCIFAHELSHPLWEELKIRKSLPPLTLDTKKLLELTERLGKQARTGRKRKGKPFEALEEAIRAPQRVPKSTLNWCQELTSDLFALALFGPAFLFSVVYFTCSFTRLDSASDSHPPTRLRLNLLFRFLDQLYKRNSFSSETKEFLQHWRNIGAQEIRVDDEVHELVLDTIRQSQIPEKLPRMVMRLLPKLPSPYKESDYRRDLKVLCPLIQAQIPPAEYLVKGQYLPASFVGILNAGWECYLQGLKGYESKLPAGKKKTAYDVKRNYNGFLLKALEINDVIGSWREANHDFVQ